MSEISTELLISNILNSMADLSNAQLGKLKEVLYIQFHDLEVTKKSYDLVTTIQDNDTMKLKYFENSLRIANKSDKTIAQYVRAAKNLRNYVSKDFSDITAFDIKFFLAENKNKKKWANITTKNTIHYLSAFFEFLLKEEFIQKNPMDKIETVKTEFVIKNPFTKTEMEKLRTVCRGSYREMALIELLVSSGIRVDECVRLNWNDIDFQRMTFVVHGKGDKEREVLFNERASFHLQKYFEYRLQKEKISLEELMQNPLFVGSRKNPKTKTYSRITDDGIRNILKTVGNAAGISEISPHKFRRTFATECLERDMPIEKLRILMGHKSVETTLKYAKIKTSSVDFAYRKICA